MNRQSIAIALLVAATSLAGCSGGNSGAGSTPVAQAPQILLSSDNSVDQDTTSRPVSFRVFDNDTAASLLQVGVASSNTDLIPTSGIKIQGTGADRTLSVRPAADEVGSATLTITVRDSGGLAASAALTARVNPVLVSFRGLTNDGFARVDSGDPAKVSGVTVQFDADDDATAFDDLLR
jgi:hypothetical protein